MAMCRSLLVSVKHKYDSKIINECMKKIKKTLIKVCFLLFFNSLFYPTINSSPNYQEEIIETIDHFNKITEYMWNENKFLRTIRKPQIIFLNADSRIYGSCKRGSGKVKNNSRVSSSYCGSTNTIYIVKEDAELFYKYNNSEGLFYLLAHEWSHALQHAWLSELETPARELQADCIAGKFISIIEKELKIRNILYLSKLSLHLGSSIHGTGDQRAHALLTGFGFFNGECTDKQIINIAKNKKESKKIIEVLNIKNVQNKSNKNDDDIRSQIVKFTEKFYSEKLQQ